MGVLLPGTYSAPFKVLSSVSPGAQSLFLAQSSSGAYALAPLFLKKTASVDITGFVTSMSWEAGDDQLYTTLSLTLDNYRGVFNQLPHGTKFRVQVRRPFYDFSGAQQGKFYDYVTAFMFEKSRSADGTSQNMTLTCYDKTYWLAQNDFHKVYKADRKKPNGWTASQIIRDIAASLKIPVGTITQTKKTFKRLELKGNALECMQKALHEDKKATKRKHSFHIDMRDGKLNVRVENTAPKTAYHFDELNSIEDGSLSERLTDKFATRVTVTGNTKSTRKTNGGSQAKIIKETKVTLSPTNPAYQQAFGIIHKNVKLKGNHSPAELRTLAKNQMDAALRPEREFTMTTRGVPHLWPNSRVLVTSGYFGVNGLVKVKNISYRVDGGEFSMTMGLAVDNKVVMGPDDLKVYYRKQPVRY